MRCLAHLSGDESMKNAYLTGKDLYSTMASEAFHTTYENCLEFYLDENGKKTDKTNPEGKLRRTRIKSVLLRNFIWKRYSISSRVIKYECRGSSKVNR